METIATDHPGIFERTLDTCQDDASYMAYSVREKMLAFIFTFLQNAATEPFFIASLNEGKPFLNTRSLQSLKIAFRDYCETLILEGTNSGEIQARPFLADYYPEVLWNAFLTILYYWLKDTSPNREHTDVMVEKTVHFAFDLLAPNAVDSGFDLLQQWIKLRKRS